MWISGMNRGWQTKSENGSTVWSCALKACRFRCGLQRGLLTVCNTYYVYSAMFSIIPIKKTLHCSVSNGPCGYANLSRRLTRDSHESARAGAAFNQIATHGRVIKTIRSLYYKVCTNIKLEIMNFEDPRLRKTK